MDMIDKLLDDLSLTGKVISNEFCRKYKVDHNTVIGQIMSLSSQENIINIEKQPLKFWQLTEEGDQILQNGSYEYRLYNIIPDSGISIETIKNSIEKADIALNKALAYKWVKMIKSGETKLFKNIDIVHDHVQNDLTLIKNNLRIDEIDKKRLDELKKRKLITQATSTIFHVTPGQNFDKNVLKKETDLTAEMISSGSYKTSEFKKYNFVSYGVAPTRGSFHPLMKVKSEITSIFLNMGFSEMPTNTFVESSFWNFDALFQPQQHPSRDAHDTFFLQNPSTATLSDVPDDYLKRVKAVHEVGNQDSLGYKYDWKIEESQKLILRTHTTAVSTRMLFELGKQKEFKPVKYFSIDRVFRNEASDSTHLSEFHQIEGVVADKNIGLNHLIGVLYDFFSKLGMHKLRFKPAFNPYTEPSMEIFSFHEGLNKWVEVGNSGIFRREMLDPMGIPEDVNVIAWGLSLERPTMIKYGINNIRSLIGHKIDLEQVQNSHICLIK